MKNLKGIIIKVTNEIVIYPLLFKKVEGISLKTYTYRFLFIKVTIIKTI